MFSCSCGTAAAAEGNGQKVQQLSVKIQQESGQVSSRCTCFVGHIPVPCSIDCWAQVLISALCFRQAVNVLREFIHGGQVSQKFRNLRDFPVCCAHISMGCCDSDYPHKASRRRWNGLWLGAAGLTCLFRDGPMEGFCELNNEGHGALCVRKCVCVCVCVCVCAFVQQPISKRHRPLPSFDQLARLQVMNLIAIPSKKVLGNVCRRS